VPTNGTSLGESYIGSAAVPNANLLTTLWSNEFTDSKGFFKSFYLAYLSNTKVELH
jgi:hypothetical protein